MRKPDPVEIVAIAAPIVAEFVAVMLMIACAAVWLIILADRVPA
jgi:hypothetical protein